MRQDVSSRTSATRLGGPLDAWPGRDAAPPELDVRRSSLVHQLVIVLVAGVIFLTNLGSAALFDMDEALYASCAREMGQRGDWVVPWFNGEVFPDKPPLMYWLMMLGRAALGPTEFAVRLQAALCAIATALVTYHLGRLLFRREVGFWAGIVVSTSIIFTISARAATVDSALTLAITGAVLAWVAGAPAWQRFSRAAPVRKRWDQPYGDTASSRSRLGSSAHRDFPQSGIAPFLPRRGWTFALVYALVAVAVLAKGPVAIVMFVGAIGLFLLMVDRLEPRPEPSGVLTRRLAWLRRLAPGRIVRAAWQMRPLTAILIVGAIAAPWYALVQLRTDGQWLTGFMAMTLGPAVKPIQGHSGTIFYHLIRIFIGFFPWSVFLGPIFIVAARRIRAGDSCRAGYVLAISWTAAVIGLWSLVALKLPHHVLPAYPALALLTAPFVYAWIQDQESMNRWWMRNAAITFVVVGVGLAVALPIVAAWLLPGDEWIGLAGVPLIVGGTACLWFSERGRSRATMVAFTATSVVFLTFGFGVAVLGVDRHQNGPPLAAAIRQAESGPPELATFRFFRESFVYYTGSRIERIHSEDALDDFVRRSDHPFVITTDEHEAMICQRFPGRFRVLDRRQRFLNDGDVVVLEGRP